MKRLELDFCDNNNQNTHQVFFPINKQNAKQLRSVFLDLMSNFAGEEGGGGGGSGRGRH